MFWSGNYIVVRELNSLLKEENVSLTQVLEADDILQECKADNKALIQFLTKPEVLAELITLITEEPPKSLELASQYRHASIACEVLTSRLPTLSDRLSMDTAQMHRLCDFVTKDPPLNPLLASYFSKTVEMLLERNPKQDCYLYHIVCLRVLDFFKCRRDFLPGLLRHMATSAIADTFKYFIRLDDLFNKIIMEWLEEHQFLECLIQIICGSYVPEEAHPTVQFAKLSSNPTEPVEKGQQEQSEKANFVNHTQSQGQTVNSEEHKGVNNLDSASNSIQGDSEQSRGDKSEAERDGASEVRSDEVPDAKQEECDSQRAEQRRQAVASANAAGLLCDLILTGCAAEISATRSRTSVSLVSRLQREDGVRALLQGIFTCGPRARHHALVHGCRLLLALLADNPILGGEAETERTSVELALAPHLPLLHHALLHEGGAAGGGRGAVGAARVHVAALLAQLCASEVEEVPTTMLTLGTPGVLVDMFFQFPDNNFLHAEVYSLVKTALNNRLYRTQYARHLLLECDLLTRLMDVYEENEHKKSGGAARSGYMGHVISLLRRIARSLEALDFAQELGLPAPLLERWERFQEQELRPTLRQHDTPLGGYYPSENTYEAEESLGVDTLDVNYEFNDLSATVALDGEDISDIDATEVLRRKKNFLDFANQRFSENIWDEETETPELGTGSGHTVEEVLDAVSPWESGEGNGVSGEGWAQFGDPFGEQFASAPPTQMDNFWGFGGDKPDTLTDRNTGNIEQSIQNLRLEKDLSVKPLDDASTVELANNLLTAMSSMTPEVIANIVNANISPQPLLNSAPVIENTIQLQDIQHQTDRLVSNEENTVPREETPVTSESEKERDDTSER